MDRVLLVGGGGREHAIAEALTRHGKVRLSAAMAVENPGIARLAASRIVTESDHDAIIKFAEKEKINYCVIGPEQPLSDGLSDHLTAAGFPCASPSQAAARIETDKSFMRSLLQRHNIEGSIKNLVTDDVEAALEFCRELEWRVAVKPIGLTAGKGVKVWQDHLREPSEVQTYIEEILTSGMSGHHQVLVEELLVGQEFTLHFLSDGNVGIPTPLVQDHKRLLDDDQGPNTGGMGSYSAENGLLPFMTAKDNQAAIAIGQEVLAALRAEGNPFKGVLYAQFMKTSVGIKVIEFNARFGDPEALNTLTLLSSDFNAICQAIIAGTLSAGQVKFLPQASIARVIVPAGYGIKSKVGTKVAIDEAGIKKAGATFIFASCKLDPAAESDAITHITTTTSRTAAIVATGATIFEAQKRTDEAFKYVSGDIFFRTDIGTKASIDRKLASLYPKDSK